MKDWIDCVLIATLTFMALAVAYFAYTSTDTDEKASIRGQVEISEQVTGMASDIIESNNGFIFKVVVVIGVVFLVALKMLIGVFERTRSGSDSGYIEAEQVSGYIEFDNNQYLK